jgi:hypothetical protein
MSNLFLSSWNNVKNNESELQKHLVLLPDGSYSSAKKIIKTIEGKKHMTELKNKFDMSGWIGQGNNVVDLVNDVLRKRNYFRVIFPTGHGYAPSG